MIFNLLGIHYMAQDPKPLLTKTEIAERKTENIGNSGLRVKRVFTKGLKDPYADITILTQYSKLRLAFAYLSIDS